VKGYSLNHSVPCSSEQRGVLAVAVFVTNASLNSIRKCSCDKLGFEATCLHRAALSICTAFQHTQVLARTSEILCWTHHW